jgi:hypothetical protein
MNACRALCGLGTIVGLTPGRSDARTFAPALLTEAARPRPGDCHAQEFQLPFPSP